LSSLTATRGYERRIGRYGLELADALIAAAEVTPAKRVLDVGCGGGALTERLVALLGADSVRAIDPDQEAVQRCRERLPGVDVRVGSAEALPYTDAEFDVVLGQLVVPAFANAEQGAREMRRVARPGGRVATCVWDFGEGMTMLRMFWDAAIATRAPNAEEHDQAKSRPYANPRDLESLWRAAGVRDVTTGALTAGADYEDFDDLWAPLAIPDGGPGVFLATLDPAGQQAIEQELRARLGDPRGPFRLTARAWYVVGTA
jgi:ubiquinone/menaquinone biosynthesis C-methylase UbiE